MTATALYMGTPVITLAGTRHGARFGATLLQAAGLPQFIARSPEEYVEKAVQLARDEEHLTNLQLGLRQQMEESALMDSRGYMRAMEREYRRLAARTKGEFA